MTELLAAWAADLNPLSILIDLAVCVPVCSLVCSLLDAWRHRRKH
jgi:hypothetical protein